MGRDEKKNNVIYDVIISKKIEKILASIPRDYREKIDAKIQLLRYDPYMADVEKLKGLKVFRARVGIYRIIYSVSDSTITIVIDMIGHRKNVYKFFKK